LSHAGPKNCLTALLVAASPHFGIARLQHQTQRGRNSAAAVLPNKQHVNVFLDGAAIEHFKAKAGARGYQTLINEALKQAMQAETLEGVIRRTIREELRRA
jgi:uncharacterized protein (DUF4415 family)